MKTTLAAAIIFVPSGLALSPSASFAENTQSVGKITVVNEAEFSLVSGQTAIVFGVRNGGGCELPAPKFENVQDLIVEKPESGALVDGGIGFLDSRSCNARVFARAISFQAPDDFSGVVHVQFRDGPRKRILVEPRTETPFQRKRRLEREAQEAQGN